MILPGEPGFKRWAGQDRRRILLFRKIPPRHCGALQKTSLYAWSGNGVTGNGTTATVATGSLAPGSYDVKATVTEGKGDRPYEVATCTASFTVKGFEPPTISCSNSLSTIKPGDTSTITAVGQSPQNRPLTYSYSTETGTVTGTVAVSLLVLDYVLLAPNVLGLFFFGKITILLYWILQMVFLGAGRIGYRYFRYTRARHHARADAGNPDAVARPSRRRRGAVARHRKRCGQENASP